MATTSTVTKETVNEISAFVKDLHSKDPMKRKRARENLVAAGQNAVIPLLHKLKDPDGQVSWEAAKALVAIKDPASATALAEALDHDDHDVRWLAAEGLVRIGSEGLKEALVALLTHSQSNYVRAGAHHVISHFAHRMSGEYLKPLLILFDGFEPAVTVPPAALNALHELQHRTTTRSKR